MAAKMSLKNGVWGMTKGDDYKSLFLDSTTKKNTPLTLTSKLVYAFVRPLARFGEHKNPAGVDSIVLM